VKIVEHPQSDVLWRQPLMAEEAGTRWVAVQMAYNVRLIGYDTERVGLFEGIASFGWCFKTRVDLEVACSVWDPVTQDEPMGWHKRVGEPRGAPERNKDPEYNRVRCIHGQYLDTGKCEIDPFCQEFRAVQS
jgi:hypothetical protein